MVARRLEAAGEIVLPLCRLRRAMAEDGRNDIGVSSVVGRIVAPGPTIVPGFARRKTCKKPDQGGEGVAVAADIDLVQLGGRHAGDVPARLASMRPAWMLMRRR